MLKKDAIEHYGSEAALAEALEISRQAVNKWPEVIPKGAAYQLQAITRGRLKVDPMMYREQRRGGST